MKKRIMMPAIAAILLVAGCKTSYVWTSGVPKDMRSVAVSTFRNESKVTELGNVASREILREFQREGTFSVARRDDAAVEIQGVVKSAGTSNARTDRKNGMRYSSYTMRATFVVSVIDKRNGRVIVDNKSYLATGEFSSNEDVQTGLRNASGRVCEDLARQVVDDVTAMQW